MNVLQKNWLSHAKKSLLCFLVLLFCANINAQTACTPTTSPGDVFYPNTVSTPTFFTNGVQYLCGPNTIVYDTISNPNSLRVYVNTGSTLFFNKGFPLGPVTHIWLKNSSTLNLVGVNGYPLNIYYEPGAIINNFASVNTSSTMCSNITFPVVNCSTGISENENLNSLISIYPNPVSSILNIESKGLFEECTQIEVINYLGQSVLRTDFKNEIDISSLSDGIYFIAISNQNNESITKKLVITR